MRLNRGGVYTQGYANDIYLLAVGKFPNMVSGLMQETIESWCNEIGLLVNPDKTELIVFTRKRIIFGFFEPLLELLWTILCWSSILGSPGFLADPEGACKYQGEEGSQFVCRRAYGAAWGLMPKVVYFLSVFTIRPSITFVSLVWCLGCQMAIPRKD